MIARRLAIAAALLGPALFALLLFKHLSYPLLWNDEGETAMYGVRILEYGYPKVHGPRNTVYLSPLPEALAVHPGSDAYIGTSWGHFYLAALGVALSDATEDPHRRTFWLRAPFAVCGALGLALLAALVAGAARNRGSGVGFAGAFFWLASLDVSLLLLLREARYPALVVLLSSLLVWAWLRREERARQRWAWSGLASAALCGLFMTFFPAFVGISLGLVASALLAGPRSAPRQLAPLGLALLFVAALLPFFRTFTVATAHAPLDADLVARVLSNLVAMGAALVLHGHGALWLATRLALWVSSAAALPAEERVAREASRLLLCLAGAYAVVMALSPGLFGRYVIPLGPWIATVVTLDALRIALRVRASTGATRRTALRAGVAAACFGLASAGWHLPALADRWHEIWNRYAGPMDHAVAFLRSRYADTSELMVATNYEDAVLMFYLDATVRSPRTWLEGERFDVVIPRRAHQPGRLAAALRQGPYRVERLPVADLPFNNIPELYRWKPLRVYELPTHRFQSPRPGPGRPPLVIHWRPAAPTD